MNRNAPTKKSQRTCERHRVEIDGKRIPLKFFSGGAQRNGVVEPVSLTSIINPDSMLLAHIGNAAARGERDRRFTISVYELAKDMSIIKTHTYGDCLFVSLDFPTVDAEGGELLVETAVFQPETYEVA